MLATGYSDEVLSGAGAGFEILRKPYDTQSLGKAIAAATGAAAPSPAAPPLATAPPP